MDDPYTRYGATADRARVSRPSVPGYLSSEAPTLTAYPIFDSTNPQGSVARPPFPGYLSYEAPSLLAHHIDLPGASSNFPQGDIRSLSPRLYAVDGILGNGVHPEPGPRATRGASIQGQHSSLKDPSLFNQRQEIFVGISPSVRAGRNSERPGYLGKNDGFTDPKGESNVLFVDGLPTDCTRREAGHLFRPFIGFREIKVVHKGPRHDNYLVRKGMFWHAIMKLYMCFFSLYLFKSGDKAMVLCFVEFVDEKCALTAMEALQGYKFDNKKPDSPELRIQFAHFPFNPSYRDDKPIGISR